MNDSRISDTRRGFEIVVPTRNRPAKLDRCLAALSVAREVADLPVLVCDSSDDLHRSQVARICAEYPFVRLRRHRGVNVAAARNECVRQAEAEVLISVDDDTRVEPGAIDELIAHYRRSVGPCVVAGSVAWDGEYRRPVVIRRIGYGRAARETESPSFLITALFAFPRALGLALPWNERIRTSDDVFAGALWRSHGVRMEFAPSSRALHDAEHNHYGVEAQSSHIYVNLFDALIANPNLRRALAYEFIGFAAGAKLYCRSPAGTIRYLSAWFEGNRNLLRDWGYLRDLVRRPLPPALRKTPESRLTGDRGPPC